MDECDETHRLDNFESVASGDGYGYKYSDYMDDDDRSGLEIGVLLVF